MVSTESTNHAVKEKEAFRDKKAGARWHTAACTLTLFVLEPVTLLKIKKTPENSDGLYQSKFIILKVKIEQ